MAGTTTLPGGATQVTGTRRAKRKRAKGAQPGTPAPVPPTHRMVSFLAKKKTEPQPIVSAKKFSKTGPPDDESAAEEAPAVPVPPSGKKAPRQGQVLLDSKAPPAPAPAPEPDEDDFGGPSDNDEDNQE